jgi:hypothetical protein
VSLTITTFIRPSAMPQAHRQPSEHFYVLTSRFDVAGLIAGLRAVKRVSIVEGISTLKVEVL